MPRRAALAFLLPFCLLANGMLGAQDNAPYTLHVYTNRVQVPTLVLSTIRQPLPPIPAEKFNISLDGGPAFHPSQVRLAGDDPISLAILLDASGEQQSLLNKFADTFAALAPEGLLPHDTVSIYAADCAMIRSAYNLDADRETLRRSVNNVLAYPTLHGTKKRSACIHQLHLWDAVAEAAKELSRLPGRRVMLIVSSGSDTASSSPWASVEEFVAFKSIAVFGLRDDSQMEDGSAMPGMRGFELAPTLPNEVPERNRFKALCERNGGLILNSTDRDLARKLQTFVTMLRGRYIIEFPRAEESSPGKHNIDISITKTPAFVAATGVVVPMPDAAQKADPNTVVLPPSQAVFGTRRPVDSGH